MENMQNMLRGGFYFLGKNLGGILKEALYVLLNKATGQLLIGVGE
jgi:hypothetical protein